MPFHYWAVFAGAILCSLNVSGQSPIVAFATSYVSASGTVSNYSALPANPGSFSSCYTTNYPHTFSNGTSNKLRLVSFTANAQTFLVSTSTPSVVKIRRVNNANATGNRSIVFLESASSPAVACPAPATLNFKTPYTDSMELALNSNAINWGTDNLFANTGNSSGNNNNIERVDVIFSSGLATSSATSAGFAILERGNNNAHDPFRIAAILSLDVNGNPASFGTVKTCVGGGGSNNGSWGHPSTANGNLQLAVYVMRKDAGEPRLRVSSHINQEFGGVFFTLADLGIAANQPVYGYALIGSDGTVNPTSSQLLNLNDAAVYPTGTPESSGGLDLIAVTGTFSTASVLASPIISLTAITSSNSVLLNWKLENATGIKTIDLERSEDGSHYSTVYSWPAAPNAMAKSFSDNPSSGQYVYRIRLTHISGNMSFSNRVGIRLYNDAAFRIVTTVISPNQPVKVVGAVNGQYKAVFYNYSGVSYKGRLVVTGGNTSIIQWTGNLPPGLYWLTISNENNQSLLWGGRVFVL